MTDIHVDAERFDSTTGRLTIAGQIFPCTLGRGGLKPEQDKREGDGATPIGAFPLRMVYYRADRLPRPETGLPCDVLTPDLGWCEKPDHPEYNRAVRLPHDAVTDRMFRDDGLYDICVVVGHNDSPVVPGLGSAIFIHMARPDFTPTAGCVGLRLEDLLTVLKSCDADTRLIVHPPKQ
jgi:L,D-peptidoglycan transpeptidase YkuD (ErfK/YbiS/YcfS/YnhG family)